MIPVLRVWPRHPLVYEINTRVWLSELSLAAGLPLRLDEVPERELDRLVTLGLDAVWLMGVWTTSPAGLAIARSEPSLQPEYLRALPDLRAEDILGSPYAVHGYQVSPTLGGDAALAHLRERLARRGLRLLLDFVPNHTASDHPATLAAPDAFVQGTAEDLVRSPRGFFRTTKGDVIAHGRDPYFPAWTDTAQVDMTSQAGRTLLHAHLEAAAARCDGVRCDMAMLVLPEVFARTWEGRVDGPFREVPFWPGAIARTLSRLPHFLFVAESYWGLEERLLDDGFHYAYDKTLYDRLKAKDAEGVRAHLRAPRAFQERCLRFVENHDEPRAAAAFGEGARSAAVATLCAPGLRLLHEGQEDGRRVKLPVQLGRRPPEPPDEDARGFYARLLEVLGRAELRQGRFTLLSVAPCAAGEESHRGLLAYRWELEEGDAGGSLIVVNLGAEPAYGRLALPGWPAGRHVLHDPAPATPARYERDGREMREPGLFVALDGHAVHLFRLEGGGTSG